MFTFNERLITMGIVLPANLHLLVRRYKSMAHLPTRHGFSHFVGFLGGSQSYTANVRWEDEHPLTNDAQFTNPPPTCVPGAADTNAYTYAKNLHAAEAAAEATPIPGCPTVELYHDETFAGSDGPQNTTTVVRPPSTPRYTSVTS